MSDIHCKFYLISINSLSIFVQIFNKTSPKIIFPFIKFCVFFFLLFAVTTQRRELNYSFHYFIINQRCDNNKQYKAIRKSMIFFYYQNFLKIFTCNLRFTYIYDLHNWPIQPFSQNYDLASHTIYVVVCVNFYT